ncbi:MAG: HAMP domain-containing protein, partial [Rickettsiales bacterium]|nr:HAMP domain-containing protein [Rickettsiales bacterium]
MTKLLSRLNIRSRMLLILITFLIPLGILAYKVNAKPTESIEFSVQEERGVEYAKPLFTLLNEVADYQIARLEVSLGTGSAEDVSQGEATIQALVDKLREIDGRIGEDLDLTVEGLKKHKLGDITFANFEKKWNAIKAAPAYSADAYTSILSDLTAMIKHTGDASNLILDGDLDTYYLVDVNFNVFAGMLSDLATIKSMGYASLHANNGVLDAAAIDALRPLADVIEKDLLTHAQSSINTAINQDTNFNGVNSGLQNTIPEKLKTFENNVKTAAVTLTALIKGGSKDASDFIMVMDGPHDGTAELAIATLDALHEMIHVRVEALKHDRMLIMGEIAGLLVLASALFWIVANSITRPVKAMTDVMGKLAAGDMSVDIPSTDTKDEVGEMARTVVVFKDNMIQTETMRSEQEAQKLRAAEEKRSAMNTMANNFEASVKTVVTEVSASAS